MSDTVLVWDLNNVLVKNGVWNRELFDTISNLKDKGIPQYVFTNTRLSILNMLRRNLKEFSLFNEVIGCKEIGYIKPDRGAFEYLVNYLKDNKIIFIDDSIKNINVSLEYGIDGIKYDSNRQILEELKLRGINI